MVAWDEKIFSLSGNQDFLDELNRFYEDEEYDQLISSLEDICALSVDNDFSNVEESNNSFCAATVVAIWSGAPFSTSGLVEEYPFIRAMASYLNDDLKEYALQIIEYAASQYEDDDLDSFIEALS